MDAESRVNRNKELSGGWSFGITGFKLNRRLLATTDAIVAEGVITNECEVAGTVYIVIKFENAILREINFSSDIHRFNGNKISLKIYDIPPGGSKPFFLSWSVPPSFVPKESRSPLKPPQHYDIVIEAWNPAPLYNRVAHMFDRRTAGAFDLIYKWPKPKASVFLSYSHQDADHKLWVQHLSDELRLRSVAVILDQDHLKAGQSISRFMESSIESKSIVIAVCSRTYQLKSNDRTGGSGTEADLLAAKLMAEPNFNVIPVLRDDRIENDSVLVPSFLKSRKYISMQGEYWRGAPLSELVSDIMYLTKVA